MPDLMIPGQSREIGKNERELPDRFPAEIAPVVIHEKKTPARLLFKSCYPAISVADHRNPAAQVFQQFSGRLLVERSLIGYPVERIACTQQMSSYFGMWKGTYKLNVIGIFEFTGQFVVGSADDEQGTIR